MDEQSFSKKTWTLQNIPGSPDFQPCRHVQVLRGVPYPFKQPGLTLRNLAKNFSKIQARTGRFEILERTARSVRGKNGRMFSRPGKKSSKKVMNMNPIYKLKLINLQVNTETPSCFTYNRNGHCFFFRRVGSLWLR